MVCHLVACSYANARRSGAASSYRFPVNIMPCGRLLIKPHGVTTAGWPVRLVVVRLELPDPVVTNGGGGAINASIFRMSSVRARCARMYSTAGIKRAVRKEFGQSPAFCPDN